MKWTQDLPAKAGYYWFAQEYQDTPIIIWVDIEFDGEACTYSLEIYDARTTLTVDNGYWYSDTPLDSLKWED